MAAAPSALTDEKAPRATIKPNDIQLEEAAVSIGYYSYLLDADARRGGLLSLGDWSYDILLDMGKKSADVQARANAASNFQPVEADADLVIDVLGFDLPKGTRDYRRLCELISQARFLGTKTALQRAD